MQAQGFQPDFPSEVQKQLADIKAHPPQLTPSNGLPRRAERPPGQWCTEHGIVPPAGSFNGRPALVTVPRGGEERTWPTS